MRMLNVIIGGLALTALSACVQQAPPELVQSVEELDRHLAAARSAEFAPEEYGRFIRQWVALRERLRADDDVVGWPWEDNPFETDLRALHEEGARVLALATERQHDTRHAATARIVRLERKLRRFTSRVDELGSRAALGERRVETELLLKQARSFLDQGHVAQAARTSQQAHERMTSQAAQLSVELSRYADEEQLARWRAQAQRAVDWSRQHRAAAIVVVKADRRLMLYKNGRVAASYPVRLGYNGMKEKRYQDDGATPEGEYLVARKRDRGQTDFYRAFLLDYPNAEDQRRFRQARRTGAVPADARIGGNIEVHGEANRRLSETLGCVMLADRHMDALFREIGVGTPVTIVGAMDSRNAVAVVLAQLDEADDDPDDETPTPDETQDAAVEQG
jgi:hypothetical protein